MKKILIISLSIIVIFVFHYIYNQTIEMKKAEEYYSKIESIKIGMSASEVIDIMGKPKEEEWVSTKGMGDEIENEYKKLYMLQYSFFTILNKVFGGGGSGDFFYLDEENGRVVCSDHFMY